MSSNSELYDNADPRTCEYGSDLSQQVSKAEGHDSSPAAIAAHHESVHERKLFCNNIQSDVVILQAENNESN